jgi:hypothetical protein
MTPASESESLESCATLHSAAVSAVLYCCLLFWLLVVLTTVSTSGGTGTVLVLVLVQSDMSGAKAAKQ